VAKVPFLVDPFIERLTVRLTWPGSRLGLELLDPGGVPAGSTTANGPTYRIVAVDAPAAGTWTARITGEEVSDTEEAYVITAGGASKLRLSMSAANVEDPSFLRLQAVGAEKARSRARGAE